MNKSEVQTKALELLKKACCSFGILASPDAQDNYRRLWARDSMISGIAGLLMDDKTIIQHWKRSLLTLAEYQHPRGIIPSNVLPNGKDKADVSYGSLAGRVDATSWFVVGACLYLLNHEEESLKNNLKPHIQKALTTLDYWEFNAKGLIYTPLSGNWADEYPVEGHTLYDNTLRLWALHLYNNLFVDPRRKQQAKRLQKKITINFWPDPTQANSSRIYHPRCFSEIAGTHPRHFACAVGPGGYNMHFDAAGHALALLLGLASDQQLQSIYRYLEEVFDQIGATLIPAFWPTITPGDPLWDALKNNYSYNFKNQPYHFHNGGIWPVWMGLFALGLKKADNRSLAPKIWGALEDLSYSEQNLFSEYIASDTLQPGGKNNLCYSASGFIFLLKAIAAETTSKLFV